MADNDFTHGPDEMNPPDEFGMPLEEEPIEDTGYVEVEAMEATMAAIASVSAEQFSATQSAIASATVAGPADVRASLVGMLSTGSLELHQSIAAAMIVDGDASIDQGGAQVMVARSVQIEGGGAVAIVADEANVARSWIGVMAARNATLSDDTRVLIDARGGLILGLLLLGGFGVVAGAIYMGARHLAARIPHLPHPHVALPRHVAMPKMPSRTDFPKLPDLSAVGKKLGRLRHAV